MLILGYDLDLLSPDGAIIAPPMSWLCRSLPTARQILGSEIVSSGYAGYVVDIG